MTNMEMRVTTGEGVRRLPIYLLLDCSGSMSGVPIESVRRGVELFIQEAVEDVYCRQTLHVGIITFDNSARMVTPGLLSVSDLTPPTISATGSTSLGEAFKVLRDSLDKDVIPVRKGRAQKGDYKPLIFVLTDGAPTDEWEGPRNEILKRQNAKVVNVITVGCGPSINLNTLKQIAVGPTFLMENTTEASFKAFFQWVSQTATSLSQSFRNSAEEQPINIPQANQQFIQYIP